MGPTTREQVALLVNKDRASDAAVAMLATKNSLEIYTAFYATMWGLMTAINPGYLQHPHTQYLYDMAAPHAWALGLPCLITGAVGLRALQMGNRKLRAKSAAVSATLWWMLAGWYLWAASPAVTSAVVAYGGAAIAEAWVYVRVTYKFDELTRAVTRHDRSIARRD